MGIRPMALPADFSYSAKMGLSMLLAAASCPERRARTETASRSANGGLACGYRSETMPGCLLASKVNARTGGFDGGSPDLMD
jgi:hypothetical protein